jgi:hypothetical protein
LVLQTQVHQHNQRMYDENRLHAAHVKRPLACRTGVKKAIGEWAKGVGTAGTAAQLAGTSLPLVWPIANAIVRTVV